MVLLSLAANRSSVCFGNAGRKIHEFVGYAHNPTTARNGNMTSVAKHAFYFLSFVMLLTCVSVLSANMGIFGRELASRSFAKWGLGAVIAQVVALFGVIVRASLKPRAFALVVSLPSKLEGIDIDRIVWNPDRCFVIYAKGKKKANIRPVLSPAAATFEIRLPPNVIEDCDERRRCRVGAFRSCGYCMESRALLCFLSVRQTLMS
jgi:hypothetical protein